ncbi:MAG: hypothetical protein KC900_00545 [Candidatus Omnitrophica bacterium]|nr:hypothetical protein [Candidatus Omnitrophota bacterium]
MLPARHLAAMRNKSGSGEREERIAALAAELEAAWEAMIPRIEENKQQRGEAPEELTVEEKEQVAESDQAAGELDAELDELISQAESAADIVELMLPLYEDEIRFWQDITRDPEFIHPQDKAVVDEVLTRQQELVILLAEYLADAG